MNAGTLMNETLSRFGVTEPYWKIVSEYMTNGILDGPLKNMSIRICDRSRGSSTIIFPGQSVDEIRGPFMYDITSSPGHRINDRAVSELASRDEFYPLRFPADYNGHESCCIAARISSMSPEEFRVVHSSWRNLAYRWARKYNMSDRTYSYFLTAFYLNENEVWSIFDGEYISAGSFLDERIAGSIENGMQAFRACKPYIEKIIVLANGIEY